MTTSEDDTALDQYFEALSVVDTPGATDVVMRLVDDGVTVGAIIREVLVPAQVRVGQRWETGAWSVADEHAATAVTEAALAVLAGQIPRQSRADRPHILIACAEGEWHSLPPKLAAAVALSGAARVTLLGASLPAEHLHRRLSSGDVDLLALSCTLPSNLLGAARSVSAAHDAKVPVIVGGRAFGTTGARAAAIGADAWSIDPLAMTAAMPALSPAVNTPPPEAVWLDTVDDATIALAYERMVAVFPRLAEMSTFAQTRTREDLRWMARFTGAAVLTADPSILSDLLGWITRLVSRVPVEVIATSAHLLADTIEPDAPEGARLLHEAADGL